MFGKDATWIGIVQTDSKRQIVYANSSNEINVAVLLGEDIQLRMHVAKQQVLFSYSLDDGHSFLTVGSPEPFFFSWWKAARPALFTFNTRSNAPADGWIDVDWVRCQALPSHEGAASEHAQSTQVRSSQLR